MWKIGLLLMVAVITGCQRSPSSEAIHPQSITLAYLTLHDCALVHLALAKGFFAQEGLQVRPQLHEFGKQALASVLAGKADLATVAETPFTLAVLNGEQVAAVASIFTSSNDNAIVGRRDHGILSPAD